MLSTKERAILAILQINPFISQQELADQIGLSRSATANLISQLVTKGYIMGKAYVLNTTRSIICIGAANVDHKLQLKQDLVFHTSNPVTSSTTVGGVIRNVAENLGRMDQNVSLLTIIGKDKHGQSLLEACKDYMSVHEVETIEDATTSSYYAVISTTGELTLGIADMDITSHMNDQWISRHKNHLATAQILVADTNIELSAMSQLISFAKESEKPLIIIGVSGPKTDRIPDNISGVKLTIFNRDETQAYFKTDISDGHKLVELWLSKGVRSAIVTAGKEGVYYGSKNKITKHQPAICDVHVVDATGAGDAFSAGVLYGYMTSRPIDEAIVFGQLNAAKTLESYDSVRKDLTRYQIEKEKELYDAK